MRRATIVAACLAAGCATTEPKLVKSVDPYNGESRYAFGPVRSQTCPGQQRVNGYATVAFLGIGDSHAMSVTYDGHGWLFLIPTAPLDILVDGKSYQLMPIKAPQREVVYGSQVRESLYYPVKNDFVRALASAKRVQFRALGSKGALEQCLDEPSLRVFQAVVPLVP